MVHDEFVQQGQVVNAAFYMEVLKRLHEHVQPVRPEKDWILHQNNAPSHTAFFVPEFFSKSDMIITDHPPYFCLI
jgi:hypothetical protein